TGESGDPWVAIAGDQLFLFNRAAGKLNYRVVEPIAAHLGPQRELDAEVFGAGDPHAAQVLANGDLLLALNVAGKLATLNVADAKGTALAFDLDTGDGPFRPEAITSVTTAD